MHVLLGIAVTTHVETRDRCEKKEMTKDTHMLEISDWGGTGQRVLAHTHGLVAVINLAYFAFLAVMV